jgi:hypothetical protein
LVRFFCILLAFLSPRCALQAGMPQLLAALEAVAAAHQPALDQAVAALDDGNKNTDDERFGGRACLVFVRLSNG